jgi:hypothetical protein
MERNGDKPVGAQIEKLTPNSQVKAYKRADARDEFYGADADYERWSDEYATVSLQHMEASFAKEEATMARLGMACRCGAHFCDGGCRR